MRGRIASASVGLSLALHGAIALRLAFTRAPASPPLDARRDIELTTFVPAIREPAPAPSESALRHASSTRTRPRPRESTAPPAAPAPPAPITAAERPPIDLFAVDALRQAPSDALRQAPSPSPADPGGHLRRATDPVASAPDERETVGSRVHDMLADAAARERASSGKVAPQWRRIERDLTQGFHPPLAVVKQESVGKALVHQILRSWLDGEPRTGPVARGVDASQETMLGTLPGTNVRNMPAEQALAVQARWGEPATSLRVEVEVIIDENGRILSARVTQPSGRRMFDRTALAAVEDAIRAGGPPEERRTVVTRWVVDAAVAVSPPTALGFRFDETGHLNPGATGWHKYLAPNYPLQQTVRSRVSLVAIEPR